MEGYRVIIDLGNSLLIVCTNYTGFLITTYIGDCHRCGALRVIVTVESYCAPIIFQSK